ncbi:Hypothetical predicted protein [Octopus vulgaris]|uniref:Uncharacterized protein n=1 Tax=Octopus vulgaris TaxID=6645 RepID=A0AA36EWK1_OCTVU|nr:Hypothetical predicted protein [Octopus vulgaris]
MKLAMILTCFFLQPLFDDCEAEIISPPKYKLSPISLEHQEKSNIFKESLALNTTDINQILAFIKEHCSSVNASVRSLLKLCKNDDQSNSVQKWGNNALGHSSDISRKILADCSVGENLEAKQYSYKPAMATWDVESKNYQYTNRSNKAEQSFPQIISPSFHFSGYDDVIRSNRSRFYICIYLTGRNSEILLKNYGYNICCSSEESILSSSNSKSLRQPHKYSLRDLRHFSFLNWDLQYNSESETVCRYHLRKRRTSSLLTKNSSGFSQKIIKWVLFCFIEILVLGLIIYNVLFCD